jgi:hypothetical protein
MANIIVKNYEHHNRSLPNWDTPKGRYINSRRQYLNEVAKAGLVSYEKSEEIRQRNEDIQKRNRKKYPKETYAFLNSVKRRTDKSGKVKLSDRQIDYMVKAGAIKDRDKLRLPLHYQDKGGFE